MFPVSQDITNRCTILNQDMDHKKVIIEELDEALKMCIKPLCNPEIHPWKDDKELKLDVTLTVLAYTPQFKNRVSSNLNNFLN